MQAEPKIARTITIPISSDEAVRELAQRMKITTHRAMCLAFERGLKALRRESMRSAG